MYILLIEHEVRREVVGFEARVMLDFRDLSRRESLHAEIRYDQVETFNPILEKTTIDLEFLLLDLHYLFQCHFPCDILRYLIEFRLAVRQFTSFNNKYYYYQKESRRRTNWQFDRSWIHSLKHLFEMIEKNKTTHN